MIHVEAQPEPEGFDERVRQRGSRFLERVPNPTSSQWRNNAYWQLFGVELRTAYRAICAYTCHFVPADVGRPTCDHFKPKDEFPGDAYEWANYRFVCGLLNGRKWTRTTLDPFEIQNGWFVLDFPSLLVRPASELDDNLRQRILDTIKTLKLNDEPTCRNAREEWVKDFCRISRFGTSTDALAFIRPKAPFIAMEIERQGLVDSLLTRMRYTDADLT